VSALRTLLVCHDGARIDQDLLARWLGSFSELGGVLVLRESGGRFGRRVRRELARVGPLRFLDVLAMRAYYRIALAARDAEWEARTLDALGARYPRLPPSLPALVAESPNTPEAESFVRERAPDLVLARCKHIIAKRVFSIPRLGTYVLHPGICPEYRNAHGSFWALAKADFDKVGVTLLRIDEGVDTGPVFGHFGYPYDSLGESHVVIQKRVILENLDAIRDRLLAIAAGAARPIDTSGRASAAWGQPWLTAYLRWKRRARRDGR
jgi:hypothetical protein